MNKTYALIDALRKNSRSDAAVKGLGTGKSSQSLQEYSQYLTPIVVAVLSALAGYFIGNAGGSVPLDVKHLASMMGMVVLFVSFIFSFMAIVNTMYFSDDLQTILQLPLTETQISFAKIAIVAERQMLIAVALVVPFALTYSLNNGVNVELLITFALELVLIPTFALSVAGIIIVVALRFLGFARNRNLLRFIGAFFMIVIIFVLVAGPTMLRQVTGMDMTATLLQFANTASQAMQSWFPVLAQLSDYAGTGNIVSMLTAVAITAVCLALFALAAKAFYLQGALAMQDSGKSSKSLGAEGVKGAMKKRKVADAIARRDVKLILRTPALLLVSVSSSFSLALMPILCGALVIFTADGSKSGAFLNLGPAVAFAFIMAGITAGFSFSSGCPARTAFSREGASFEITSTLPISPRDLMMGKRNAALRMAIYTNMLLMLIILVVLIVAGKLNPVAILFAPGIFIAVSIIIVDISVLADAKSPNFAWKDANQLNKFKVSALFLPLGIFVAFAVMGILMGLIGALVGFDASSIGVAVVVTVAAFLLGKPFDSRLINKGPEYLGLVPTEGMVK